MKLRDLFMLLILSAACSAELANAANFDPFGAYGEVSHSAAKMPSVLDGMQDPCGAHKNLQEIWAPLDLLAVIEIALCNHPQTRSAWANVKAQAAQVGISEAAYLPSANVTGSLGKGPTSVQQTGGSESSNDGTARSEALNLNWTLFDFGLRRANLENSRYLLKAAVATQDATLQTVFVGAAQAYYNLLSAQAMTDASIEAERSAQRIFMIADGKYSVGVGALADKLQAQTSHVQAKLSRDKAERDLQIARGNLAAAMGMQTNVTYSVDVDQATLPNTSFVRSINELIEEAKREHPSMIAAQAQLQAAQASVDAARAEGLPSVGLTATISRNDQLDQFPYGPFYPSSDYFTRSKSIGIVITIPLFEGFGRSYQIQAAKALAEAKAVDAANTEIQVSLNVWTSYQTLSAETENLKSTEELLHSAQQSFDVARGRYQSGVGTMIELLNAQSALASARQQQIEAQSNWRVARLQLAASLGKLDMSLIH